MKPKYSISPFILLSFISLFFIDRDAVFELIFKLGADISLLVFYLASTKKINKWYLFVLIDYCLMAYFLIYDGTLLFGVDYLLIGTFLMIFNRIFYIAVPLKSIYKIQKKKLFTYSLLFFIPAFVALPLIISFLNQFSIFAIIIGVLSALMCSFAFLRNLTFNSSKNAMFFIALLILAIADFLIVYNKFILYDIFIVITYSTLYYLSRYLICKSLIKT